MHHRRLRQLVVSSIVLHLSTAGVLAQDATPAEPVPAVPVPEPQPSIASTIVAVASDDAEPLPLRWAALERLRTLKMGSSKEEQSAVLGSLFSMASRESDHPKLRLRALNVIDEFLGAVDTDHSAFGRSFDVLSCTSVSILQSKRTDDDVQIAAVAIAIKHSPNASTEARKLLLRACKNATHISDTLPSVREFLISSAQNQ